MGISLLYASPQSEAAYKNSTNRSYKHGAECRIKSTGSDFKAINYRCNTAHNRITLECAKQEVSCSESVYRAKCNEQTREQKPKAHNNCYAPYAKKVAQALKYNASQDPTTHMGISLLNGSPQCTAQNKACKDRAFDQGVKCRQSKHGGLDPVAVNKKCNTVVHQGFINCAQQEVKCSAQAFKRKCGM